MYANLTNDQKSAIRLQYRAAIQMNNGHTEQAVAVAADNGLRLTVRQWNGKAGANAFAAALATLVMAGDVKIADHSDANNQVSAPTIPGVTH